MQRPARIDQSTIGTQPLAALAVVGLAIAGAGLVGLAVTWLSPGLGLGLLVAVVVLAGLVAVRQALRPTSVGVSASLLYSEARDRLWPPRLLFYLGTLFVGQLTFELVFGLSISDLCFLAALGGTVYVRFATDHRLTFSSPGPLLAGAGLFAVGGLLAATRSEFPVQSTMVLIRFLFMVTIWLWLASTVLRRPEHLRTALWCLAGSGALNGGAAIAQLVWGDVIPGSSPYWGRMTGFTPHMNELGGTTSVALVPALLLTTRLASSTLARVAAGLMTLAIAAGLLLSGSVGAALAAALGVAIWLAASRSSARVLLLFVVAGLGATFVIGLQQESGAPTFDERIRRVTDSSGSDNGTLFSRLETYRSAWLEIGRNPFIGKGLDDESSRTDVLGDVAPPTGGRILKGLQVHNIFLGAWFTAGLAGFIGLILIVATIFRTGKAAVSAATSQFEWLIAVALLASFVTFIAYGMTAPLLGQRYGWIAAVLILAARAGQQPAARKVPIQVAAQAPARLRSFPSGIATELRR